MPSNQSARFNTSGFPLGFETKLWLAADTAMRDNASLPREVILRSLSKAKDNLRNPTLSAA